MDTVSVSVSVAGPSVGVEAQDVRLEASLSQILDWSVEERVTFRHGDFYIDLNAVEFEFPSRTQAYHFILALLSALRMCHHEGAFYHSW